VLGFASGARIAGLFDLDLDEVDELLLDFEACGWVTRSSFSGTSGWSLTDLGRTEGERRLAVELEQVGARPLVESVHAGFLPLNRRFVASCTDWQSRPVRGDPLAVNDHSDLEWDGRVLDSFAALGRSMERLLEPLAAVLARFVRYPVRYRIALARVETGQHSWVDAPGRDSLHTVWIQLHEDLLATLGMLRGDDA